MLLLEGESWSADLSESRYNTCGTMTDPFPPTLREQQRSPVCEQFSAPRTKILRCDTRAMCVKSTRLRGVRTKNGKLFCLRRWICFLLVMALCSPAVNNVSWAAVVLSLAECENVTFIPQQKIKKRAYREPVYNTATCFCICADCHGKFLSLCLPHEFRGHLTPRKTKHQYLLRSFAS